MRPDTTYLRRLPTAQSIFECIISESSARQVSGKTAQKDCWGEHFSVFSSVPCVLVVIGGGSDSDRRPGMTLRDPVFFFLSMSPPVGFEMSPSRLSMPCETSPVAVVVPIRLFGGSDNPNQSELLVVSSGIKSVNVQCVSVRVCVVKPWCRRRRCVLATMPSFYWRVPSTAQKVIANG